MSAGLHAQSTRTGLASSSSPGAAATSAASEAAARPEVLGPLYPIAEPDMLEQIEARLRAMERSGELQRLMREGQERGVRSAQYPKPVDGVGRAMANRSYTFDPSVRVPRDVTDDNGRVLVKAGTVVNPLDYVAMAKWLVFFDGRDAGQVALAHRLGEQYGWAIKPILVAGGPLDVSRRWKRQVYFDQGGFLVQRLGIRNVPALVTQQGKVLRIDELRY
jgi:conjugal transfer pilus assembly protein TraW